MRVPAIILPLFDKYANTTTSEYLFCFHDRFSTSDSFNANATETIFNISVRFFDSSLFFVL